MRPLGCAGFRYRAAVVTGTSPIRIGLLGYGTVGSAVHRLLRESAESIERVTGQPVEVAAALVRDPARHPDAPDGVLTTDFARLRDDPTITVVAEVMGGIEPAREHVLALLASRQVGGVRQQAAAVPARRRAVRRGRAKRRAAAVRGQRLRRDTGGEGAARVDDRDQRAPDRRHRQRHHQLHPDAHDPERRPLRRGAGRGAGTGLRGGGSHRGRDRRRCRRQDRDPGVDRVPHPDAAGGGRPRRHQPARPGRRGARGRARVRGQADRIGLAVGWPGGGAGASLPAGGEPPAGGRGRRLQRGDAAGQLDPRGDPGGARAPAATRRPRP